MVSNVIREVLIFIAELAVFALLLGLMVIVLVIA
jgi:hypothetical protein